MVFYTKFTCFFHSYELISKRKIFYYGKPLERFARYGSRNSFCRTVQRGQIQRDQYAVPGYGYAAVPEAVRQHWVTLLGDYLQTRRQLIGLVLIMDCRHPLKPLDIQMLDFFAKTGRPVHILLSKADKLSKNEQIKTLSSVKKALKPFSEQQDVSVQLFSSLKKQGMEEVENVVGGWFARLEPELSEEDCPV